MVPSDFEAIGGFTTLARVVVEFYLRVTADPQIGHYFEGKDVHRIGAHLTGFVGMLLGGPAVPSVDLRAVHHSVHPSSQDFDHMMAVMSETLEAAGVEPRLAGRLVGRLYEYKHEVTQA